MKRWAWAVAVGCFALFAGVVWYQVRAHGNARSSYITARQAEQRYYDGGPRHWSRLLINH